MGINKILPNSVKNFLKNKLRFPQNAYQNVHTHIKVDNYHSNDFNKFHNYFSKKDLHIFNDTNVTRLRNYNNSKFADLAIRNNPMGSLLSVGISFGTTLKVITHLLDAKAQSNNYYIIDNFKNVGNLKYNTNIDNVKDDLKDINNFKFNFIEKLMDEKILDLVDNNLTFVHLNTGNPEIEHACLDKIVKKCLKGAIIIIDCYGFLKKEERVKFDEYLNINQNIHSYVSPSLQLILTIN